ncbi:hypothetical protein DRQ23_01930 [bacterium]|nr:MAG: hypothetical protein DRQ23_01930 [bacterium]
MNVFLKAFFFLLSFTLFHFGYELTGFGVLKPFCGINESVFQHLKMAFWGYGLLAIFEYWYLKGKKGFKQNGFWYSRVLSMVVVPWVVFLLWYIVPAVYGRINSLLPELIWAVLITYSSGLVVSTIEKDMERIGFRRGAGVSIITMLVISVFLFTIFTYKLPWLDMFEIP